MTWEKQETLPTMDGILILWDSIIAIPNRATKDGRCTCNGVVNSCIFSCGKYVCKHYRNFPRYAECLNSEAICDKIGD